MIKLKNFKDYCYSLNEQDQTHSAEWWRNAGLNGYICDTNWAGFDQGICDEWQDLTSEEEKTWKGPGSIQGFEKNLPFPIDESEGKCPEAGCVVEREKGWVVISNDTGKCWGRSKEDDDSECTYYDSEKKADAALKAYHS